MEHRRRWTGLWRSIRPAGPVLLAVGLTAAMMGQGRTARANLVITPTFDSSITSDPNASTIEATINGAIAQYASLFSDNMSINIKFQEGGGLGSSSTWIYTTSYQTYHNALTADATSTDDATALASLPNQSTSPVDGNTNMYVTYANLKAIGLNPSATPDGFAGTITLNTSIMNLSRTGPQDPGKYDLQSVVQHEIDEVLGLGSGLNLPTNFPRLSHPQDLFRYSAPGVRSYTTASGASAYLSFDGGVTNLVNFNQAGNGSADYGDWASSGVARVQDAYGTPGAQPNLGVELRNLDVIGYTLAHQGPAVPEPASLVMAMTAAAGLLGFRVARRKSN